MVDGLRTTGEGLAQFTMSLKLFVRKPGLLLQTSYGELEASNQTSLLVSRSIPLQLQHRGPYII
jgi:hypothetical protein